MGSSVILDINEISIYEFKKIFFKIYGVDFIDGFRLFQSPLNVVQYGDFKLYDNYADEDIYVQLPILKNLFQKEEEIYLYTDLAYYETNIFVLKSNEIKSFLKNFQLDIFSNEPLFINLQSDSAFGYCLEGLELNSGIFFQLDLTHLRETNKKLQIKKLVNILSNYYYSRK